MATTSKKKNAKRRASSKDAWAEIKNARVNALELSRIGSGELGYVRKITYSQALDTYPGITGVSKQGEYFSLHSAEGDPMALTESPEIAVWIGKSEDLEVRLVN